MDDMKMEWSAHTDTLGDSSWAMQCDMHIWLCVKTHAKNGVWGVSVYIPVHRIICRCRESHWCYRRVVCSTLIKTFWKNACTCTRVHHQVCFIWRNRSNGSRSLCFYRSESIRSQTLHGLLTEKTRKTFRCSHKAWLWQTLTSVSRLGVNTATARQLLCRVDVDVATLPPVSPRPWRDLSCCSRSTFSDRRSLLSWTIRSSHPWPCLFPWCPCLCLCLFSLCPCLCSSDSLRAALALVDFFFYAVTRWWRDQGSQHSGIKIQKHRRRVRALERRNAKKQTWDAWPHEQFMWTTRKNTNILAARLSNSVFHDHTECFHSGGLCSRDLENLLSHLFNLCFCRCSGCCALSLACPPSPASSHLSWCRRQRSLWTGSRSRARSSRMLPAWLECRLGICAPARSSGVPHTSSEVWASTLRSRWHCDTCPTRLLQLSSPECSTSVSSPTLLDTADPRLRGTISVWTTNPRTSSDLRRTGLAFRSTVCRLLLPARAVLACSTCSALAVRAFLSCASVVIAVSCCCRRTFTCWMATAICSCSSGRTRCYPQCVFVSSIRARSELRPRQQIWNHVFSGRVCHQRFLELSLLNQIPVRQQGSRLRYHVVSACKRTCHTHTGFALGERGCRIVWLMLMRALTACSTKEGILTDWSTLLDLCMSSTAHVLCSLGLVPWHVLLQMCKQGHSFLSLSLGFTVFTCNNEHQCCQVITEWT